MPRFICPQEAETAEKTRVALEALLHSKIRAKNAASGKDSGADIPGEADKEPSYVRYTANPDAPGTPHHPFRSTCIYALDPA